MCTFIINDLDDVEKDRINHPERPLPSAQVPPYLVALFYYVCLASALLTIRFCIGAHYISFFYYLLLTLSISYSYVVEYLPAMKPVYVAGASSIPVLIVTTYYPRETSLYWVAVAIFFFNLGRELCKDLPDRPGDPVSVLHAIDPRRVAVAAFGFQAAGLGLLSLHIKTLLGFLAILVMAMLFAVAYICWFRLDRVTQALALMKAMIFCGLYFLL
jgi:geranylgeranylglycerol-phosphate geranylgeranyltransferase